MDKIQQFFAEQFAKLNALGFPIPLIRDPKTGKGSVTLTLVFISFNTALLGQFGKAVGFLGGVDLSQANYLFLMSLGAYLGRKMQGDGKKVDMAEVSKPEEK